MAENEKTGEQNENIFNTWIESYTAISKMWEESYTKLYRPWLESTGELFEKAIEAASSNSPEKYREFYDAWTNTFQGRVDRFRQIPTAETNKEILEKLLVGAEKSTDIYRSWIIELEENSKKTREALKGEADPVKYKEVYDLWIKSYARIFDELLTLPFRDNIREMFEKYTGIPDIYSDTFIKISRLWNDSYTKLYGTWMEAILELSKKSEEISKGKATPESYKEFYTLWADVYQKTYGKFLNIPAEGEEQLKLSKDKLKTTFETFAQSTQVYTGLYKSWITALEKLSLKSKELAKQPANREVYKDTFNLWIKLYQKAFESFFDNIPVAGPFKEFFTPVKSAANIYVDNLKKVSDFWLQSYGTLYRA